MSRRLELITRALFLFWGSVMLLFGTWDLLVPRARYVGSSLEPGAVVSSPPAAVTVSFSEELAPESEINVASTVSLSPSGERVYSGGEKVTAASGLDLGDPRRRTLRADLEPGLPGGLYVVNWKAVAAQGRAKRFGRFYFGAGMAVPEHIMSEMRGTLRERDYEYPLWGRRSALLGGVLLVALGALLPRLTRVR